jgi:hypothetical protein
VGCLQTVGVTVDGDDVRTELRGRDGVPSLPTRNVQHLDARLDEPAMPIEPGARPLILIVS